jgi:eukaryotic translation initiation factor 2C
MPKGPIYEYSVEIEPKTMNKMKGRLFQLLEQHPTFAPHVEYIAHDRGARLVAAKKLPQPLVIPIKFSEEGFPAPLPDAKTYTMTIKENGELEMATLQKYAITDWFCCSCVLMECRLGISTPNQLLGTMTLYLSSQP